MATEATTILTSLISDSPLRKAIMLLLVASVVLIVIKPDIMYDERDQFRTFGTGQEQSLMPFWLAITLVGLVGYYLTLAMDD